MVTCLGWVNSMVDMGLLIFVGLAVAEGIDRGAAVLLQPMGGPYSPGGPPLFVLSPKTTSLLKPVNYFHALHLRH